MKLQYSLLLAVLLTCLSGYTQGLSLSGSVNDAKDNSPLIGAAVSIAPTRDTNNVTGALADYDGHFAISGLRKGTYMIKVTYIGYEKLVRYVKIDSTSKNIGALKLNPESTKIKDVDIVAEANHVKQKADTTEYNANTFKTNPDATAEDLLNKMPGISSSGGTVTAHGETVGKVLVDGKEFFGEDATAALKNLPAEVIDKVQVFDRQSDQSSFTGFDDGNTTKTINISTKKGRNNGVFGKFYAGYGYIDNSYYSAGGNINWFNGDRRISVIGMSNDINQQNFASQDLLGVSGTTGGGGRGGGRGGQGGGGGQSSNNFLVGQQGGISTTHSVGLNYIDVLGAKRKVKITGSYFFNQTENNAITSLSRQYYNKGENASLYNENDTSHSVNQNHRINLRIEYAIDSNNALIITPKFSYQANTSWYGLAGQTLLAGKEQSRTASDIYSYNAGYNFSADVLYQHKFAVKFRTFSIDIGTAINNKKGYGSQNSYSYYDTTGSYIPVDQQNTSYNKSYNVNANVSFTEPAGKSGMVQFNYTPSYTLSKSDKETDTLNATEHTYTMLDTLLSNKYDNQYLTQKIGFSYRFRSEQVNFMIGVNGQEATLSGTNYFPRTYDTKLTFLSILPNAMLNYRFKNTTTLRIFYRTSTSAPSISQLQSVIDNSNPLLLSTGNPNLNQSYNNSLTIRWGFAKGPKGQSAFAFATVSNTMNNVANSTFIASKDTLINNQVILHRGSQLTQPVNINGYWNANIFLTYGVALPQIKCNLNINAGFNYGRTPGLINNALSISNTYVPTGGFVLSSNISEKIDFTINYSATYNVVQNTLQTSANNNYFTHTAGGKFNWLFWKGFVFNTSLQNTLYRGISQGFNQDILLWNAALGYKFLKDKSLELKAGVNDILNQSSGISRTVSQTYIEDDRTQVLKRYWMVTLTYTLRQFKKQKNSEFGAP